MHKQIFTNWWLLALKGATLILLGILAFIFPLKAILSIVFVIGLLLVLAGVFLIAQSLINRSHYKFWLLWLLEGVVDLIFGFVMLFSPIEVTAALFMLVGFWAIASGLLQIICGVMIRWRRFFWILNGLLSAILGTLLVLNPFAGAVIASYFIAIHCIALGSLGIYIAFEFKQIHDKHEEAYLLIH